MQATLDTSTLRIAFAGDLLSTNVGSLRPKLLAALAENPTAQSVVADLARAGSVDSQGLNLLLSLFRETERRKIGFRVENPNPEVRRLLTLLNLATRFGLSPSLSP